MRQLRKLWIATAGSALLLLMTGQAYAVDSEALGDELTKTGQTLKTSKVKDDKTDGKNSETENETPPAPVAPTA